MVNATFTTSGSLVTNKQVDDALSEVESIRDFKVEQISPKEYIAKLVTRDDKKNAENSAAEAMRSIYGRNAEVKIIHCDDIEPEAPGKYRRTKTNIEFDEKELLA
jgi:hypothetical protein